MKNIYQDILVSITQRKKLLAVLIDPDKMAIEMAAEFIEKVNKSLVTHIFVGGSTVKEYVTGKLISEIKKFTELPIIIFPGDVSQITSNADAVLFLSLISGRNPEYLIGKQVEAVSKLRNADIEVIPTGYLLIENGKHTSVELVSATKPMPRHNVQLIVDTAKAGELLGMKGIYLEAGSGAIHPIDSNIISSVKTEVKIPLIVGGGIRSIEHINLAYNSGADMVVIGTAFEEDDTFFDEL